MSIRESHETRNPPDPPTEATLYYVDGYHGGIKGHMPLGAWRDILSVMRRRPDWKICVDIEPISWTYLRRRDPQSYHELKAYLADTRVDARVEMVAASFAQPYGWVIGGESNIRHLTRGLAILREHFPGIVVDTYAVQEPCWTSALPQILLSLGFKRAVLKNPSTAWAGYAAGFDADVVRWVGPDGSAIPCVPRYACEELRNCWETESAYGTAEFARKCLNHGITRPTGMYFQDCGWPAKPRVQGPHIRYVTWREYVETVAPPTEKDWRFSQEDILCTLPWGDMTLQRLAREVRSAENRILAAEKMAAVAAVWSGIAWPGEKLREAWDQLLLAQHHDAWICARSGWGRRQWAWQVGAETWAAETICDEIIARSAEALASVSRGETTEDRSGRVQTWCVFNTLGAARTDLVELALTADIGTRSFRVSTPGGEEIPVQFATTRKHSEDQSVNAARVLFRAETPALGCAAYRIESRTEEPLPRQEGAKAEQRGDGSIAMESDLYRILIDPARGGVVTSLFAKALNKEFALAEGERQFLELRGFFVDENAWRSSADAPAKATIAENGPLRARVNLTGKIGDAVLFSTTITLCQGQRRIDAQTALTFLRDTHIGNPAQVDPREARTSRYKSHHDARHKLQAFFPLALKGLNIYKNAAYDVCRSRQTDTFFQTWDAIKHNIILDWVDAVDDREEFGLTLLSDHTTSYSHAPDHPLALTLAWGWDGGSWWGRCTLRGHMETHYAFIPHAGKWNEARVSEECARWKEPLLGQIVVDPAARDGALRAALSRRNAATGSILSISGSGIEVPTLLIDGDDLLVRLFNAEGDERPRVMTFAVRPSRVECVELDGRFIRLLDMVQGPDGRWRTELAIPRFGLRTLRLAGFVKTRKG